MHTTLRKIKGHTPCKEEWFKLLENLGYKDYLSLTDEQKDKPISIEYILNNHSVKEAFWVLRTLDYKEYCLILADVAESVLHIYEAKNDNKAPRDSIQAIRAYKAGEISKEELKIAAAAAADADAYAYAAAAAAAAYAAADAAAAHASHAAHAARKRQWKKNEEILRKYL